MFSSFSFLTTDALKEKKKTKEEGRRKCGSSHFVSSSHKKGGKRRGKGVSPTYIYVMKKEVGKRERNG